MYLYEVVSPGYSKMWVHTPLRQYVEARPWLLSLLSLSILQPAYKRHTLIHIPDSQCPLREATSIQQNTLISQSLQNQSYSESSHLFAIKANNTYYEFQFTAKGDYIENEIPFLGGNVFILVCLIVSGLLAAYCVLAMSFTLIRLKWKLEEKLKAYLDKNRRFALAKKEIQHKNDETKKKLVTVKSKKRLVKILKMNVFTTTIKTKSIDLNEEEEDEILTKQKVKKRISLSFFQAPTLYLEHLRRSRANSFKFFLNNIYESAAHFPKWKLVSDDFYKTISVRLDQLVPKYLEYCTKEGLKARPIEEENDILLDFNLKLEYKIDTTTDAYTNIRWKTPLEKLDELEARKSAGKAALSKDEQGGIIAKFLTSECSKSSFKRDYILVSELIVRYDQYCRDMKIDDLLKINIVGCPELDDFGARYDSNLYIPYISGIAFTKIPGLRNSDYIPGIIRIPKESKARERKVGICRKIKNKLMFFLFSSEGVLTNLLVVIIHLVLLIGFPLIIFLAVVWSLLQIQNINENIFSVNPDIFDIFYASSYDFWLNHIEGVLVFYIMAGLCGFFFLSGLIELVSFYATGPRDTGKYIVQKSFCKWMITIMFWVILALFISLYTAYISVILVWCILGAVLNPQKFLPMAVGAVVIIAFSILIYSRLKHVNKSLEGIVGESVDQELKQSLIETIRKEMAKYSKMRNPTIEGNTKDQFHRAMNNYMSKNNYPPVTRDTTDSILNGDLGQLIMVLNKNCGIDNNISLALVGWLKQDASIIMGAISKLSMDLNLDVNLNNVVTEIALDNYNPDSVGINQAQGTIILSLKKLFRKAFPQFPLETLDGLLQVVSEGDPRPLEMIVKKLNIPLPLFQLAIGFVMSDKAQILSSVNEIAFDILPKYYTNLFDSMFRIFKGNPKAGLEDITYNLNIPHEFLTQFIVAVTKQDNSLVRYVLNSSVDQIFKSVSRQGIYIEKEAAFNLKNYLLALYTLTKGSDIDLIGMAKVHLPKLDPFITTAFYDSSKGDLKKFDRILDHMNIASQKKAVLEFSHLLFEKDTDMTEIGGRLGVVPENSEVLHAAVRLVVLTSRYYIKIWPKLQELKSLDEGKRSDERTQMTETIINLSGSIKKYLHVLYFSDVLHVDLTGFSGEIMKIGSFIKELFYEFTGEEEYRDTPRYRKLDVSVRKEKFTAAINTLTQKILKGDQKAVDTILTEVLEFLEFKTEKKNYFKALTIMVTSFAVDQPLKEIDNAYDTQLAFKLTSVLLELDEEYLEFILDIFSGNPYRIFKCNNMNPKIDLKTFDIVADFYPARIGMISDILAVPRRKVKKLSAIWIHNYDLVFRGENFIKKLGTERLNVDPMFFFFVIKD